MRNIIILGLISTSLFAISCRKFLDQKPNDALTIPQSLKDLQALLDNAAVMNNAVFDGLGEGSADNYYITDANWTSLSSEADKAVYAWGDEIFFDYFPNEWSKAYRVVNFSNLVLETLNKIEKSTVNEFDWQNVKGAALFYRARVFLNLVANWGKAYDPTTSSVDLGIPLRLSSDFNPPSVRLMVAQCYDQILRDLSEASGLLPVNGGHVFRPCKPAAFALLARTYLSMRNYVAAGDYADSSLKYFNVLLNYKDVNKTANFPFPQFNKEVIFHSVITLPQNLTNTRAVIDSNLYSSYETTDIRKIAFFRSNGNGTFGFKGSYNGSIILFDGIACDEVYLTRAECFARNGNLTKALNDLNALLVTRYEPNTFINFTSNNQGDIIRKILLERRKQLLMRNIRWQDLKRLNMEAEHKISIKRKLNGTEYILLPNDNKYSLPLPGYILNLTGMPQNPR
ncbi:MAG TPA: RagB/SusD family nutrient uptake outer membrane protein [Chitinophagaceae bacterium]